MGKIWDRLSPALVPQRFLASTRKEVLSWHHHDKELGRIVGRCSVQRIRLLPLRRQYRDAAKTGWLSMKLIEHRKLAWQAIHQSRTAPEPVEQADVPTALVREYVPAVDVLEVGNDSAGNKEIEIDYPWTRAHLPV